MTSREIATISIYPAPGRAHSPERHLSALAGYTRSLLHALPEHERTRHLVITNLKREHGRVFVDNGIEVHEAWSKGSQRFAWQIIRAIRARPSLKLVHLQHEFNQFGGVFTVPMIPLMLWIIRFVLKRKVVVTYHEIVGRGWLNRDLVKHYQLPVPGFAAHRLFRWYYRLTSLAADEVLVQHGRLRDILREEMGVGKSVVILPHGADDQLASADRIASRRKFGIGMHERMLLFFGTLDWRKGLDILVDALDLLPGSYRLFIAGGQPVRIRHRPQYQAWHAALVVKAEKNRNISLIGFVADEDLSALFAAADLVTLPYLLPGAVSAVLSLAVSYDRPFIGSTVFEYGLDPLVLFEADAEHLAQKIRWCFDGHEQEMLEYARRYRKENSWTHSAAILATCHARVLGTGLEDGTAGREAVRKRPD